MARPAGESAFFLVCFDAAVVEPLAKHVVLPDIRALGQLVRVLVDLGHLVDLGTEHLVPIASHGTYMF